MLPNEWNAAMNGTPWQDAYAAVEREVKAAFAHNPLLEHDTLSTSGLVEVLYPETYARGDGALARRRIFKALQALATRGLSAYASQGPSKLNRMKVSVRPWFWRQPAPVVIEPDRRDLALQRIVNDETLGVLEMRSIAAEALTL